MGDYQTILYTVDGAVAILCLNRPQRRNALSAEMLDELYSALRRAEDDDAVRALLLTGAGSGFCAGQDLAVFAQQPSANQIQETILRHYKPVILAICRLAKPVVAAVNGVAAGAGASLALACDLRIMAHDASLMQAFINIGLVPDAGSSWFLSRLVGYSRALEIAVEGERIPAPRCQELGLANRVVAADQLQAEALAWAGRLAQRPTYALGLTKELLQLASTHSLEQMIHIEAEMQALAVVSADHREGVAAFLEKRQPDFQGR